MATVHCTPTSPRSYECVHAHVCDSTLQYFCTTRSGKHPSAAFSCEQAREARNSVHATPMQSRSQSSERPSALSAERLLSRLEELVRAVHQAQTELQRDVEQRREAVRAELDGVIKVQQEVAGKMECTARALAIRGMELDNRALALEKEQVQMERREREVSDGVKRVKRVEEGIREREIGLKGREASLKYSAVEQGRLYEWARELEERERKLGEAEKMEAEGVRDRVAMVVAREAGLGEREKRVREREMAVEKREKEVEMRKKSVEKELRTMRECFWVEQRKVTGVVAKEVEALWEEQRRLKDSFEKESKRAKEVLKEMGEELHRMRGNLDGVDANPAS